MPSRVGAAQCTGLPTPTAKREEKRGRVKRVLGWWGPAVGRVADEVTRDPPRVAHSGTLHHQPNSLISPLPTPFNHSLGGIGVARARVAGGLRPVLSPPNAAPQ